MLMRDILGRLTESRLYDIMTSSLLTEEQSQALRERISKKIRENLDSM
jgi:hypothetical protein